MKKLLALAIATPLLLGAKYVEPTDDYATVEFSGSGNPQATFHKNGVDCSGMETLPGQRFYFGGSAAPIRVAGGQPVAFKLFQLKGMSASGVPGLTAINGCHVATSFTPVSGATYRVHLNGLACSVDVFAKTANGQETPEPSARARTVKPPFRPSGPFCRNEA